MKQLTISFFDHFLCFHPADAADSAPVFPGGVTCADDDLDSVFDTLLQGADVLVLYSHGFKRIVSYLMSRFRFVRAAGGVVTDPQGNSLLIFREGCWDIPKGMVEPGESLAQAAIREVEEETGISHIALDSLLVKTYHIYNKYGGWHLKQTSWFRMHTSAAQPTVPQTAEGITRAEWVPPTLCHTHLASSFASLKIVSQKL